MKWKRRICSFVFALAFMISSVNISVLEMPVMAAFAKDSNMLEECTPYSLEGATIEDSIVMSGITYHDAIKVSLDSDSHQRFIEFNLSGLYHSVEFEVGHIDETGTANGNIVLSIYKDGKLSDSYELNITDIAKKIKCDTTNVSQLEIAITYDYYTGIKGYFGIGALNFQRSGSQPSNGRVVNSSFLTYCPPYSYDAKLNETFVMGGVTYTDAIKVSLDSGKKRRSMAFNLQEMYQSIEFSAGHIDGTGMANHSVAVSLYGDGALLDSYEIGLYDIPKLISCDVKGISQFEIVVEYQYVTGVKGSLGIGGLKSLSMAEVQSLKIDSEKTVLAGESVEIAGELKLTNDSQTSADILMGELARIIWTSSDPAIVEEEEIDCTGINSADLLSSALTIHFLPKKAGNVIITGTAPNGLTAVCQVTIEEPKKTDKTELEALIKRAPRGEDKEKYTEESWRLFETAYEEAVYINQLKEATQEEVNRAALNLQESIEKLEEKPVESDKTELEAIMGRAPREEDKEKYTEESWQRFQVAYEEAVYIKQLKEATQEEVNRVALNLQESIEKLEEKPIESDKTELEALMKRAPREEDKEKYTEESWRLFETAYEEAVYINQLKEATQEEVNRAALNLQKAIKGLVKNSQTPIMPEQADKSRLKEKINYALTELDAAKYTEESWKKFYEALKKAIEVKDNEKASQDQVNQAVEILQSAMDALKEKDSIGNESVKTDYTKLNKNIENARKCRAGDYTQASYNFLKKNLVDAEKIAGNSHAAQNDVDRANAQLEKAIQGLVKLVTVSSAKITLGVKQTYTAVGKNCSFTTSNHQIVSVSAKGKITAKKTGKAVIKSISQDGRAAVYHITVKKAPEKILKIILPKKVFKKGMKSALKVKLPKKTAASLTFKSNRPKVAFVNSKGVVFAKKKGTAKITVITHNGKKKSVTIRVK